MAPLAPPLYPPLLGYYKYVLWPHTGYAHGSKVAPDFAGKVSHCKLLAQVHQANISKPFDRWQHDVRFLTVRYKRFVSITLGLARV